MMIIQSLEIICIFADDRLIRSDIFGTVWDLKRDLRSQDITFEYIRAARMDFAEV